MTHNYIAKRILKDTEENVVIWRRHSGHNIFFTLISGVKIELRHDNPSGNPIYLRISAGNWGGSILWPKIKKRGLFGKPDTYENSSDQELADTLQKIEKTIIKQEKLSEELSIQESEKLEQELFKQICFGEVGDIEKYLFKKFL